MDEHACDVKSLDFAEGAEIFPVLRKDDLCGGFLLDTGKRDSFHFFHASFAVLGASVAAWRGVSSGVDSFVKRVFFFSGKVASSVIPFKFIEIITTSADSEFLFDFYLIGSAVSI